MAKITYVTGGQRSGKSSYAQNLAESLTDKPIYLATSRIWDDSHHERIKRHQKDRGENWRTIEKDKNIGELDLTKEVVLMDCVTLWLNNFFFDNGNDVQKSLTDAKREFDLFVKQDIELIVVSNEIGMGAFPIDKIQAKFTDLQGWVNQYIAQKADKAIFMVSGIPINLK